VILYDPAYYPTPTGDGEIVVQYLVSMQQAYSTLGIENFSETIGIQYYFDGSYHEWAALVTDSFALKYTTYLPNYPGIQEHSELGNVPARTMLSNLYPNPFYQKTVIRYQIADIEETKHISLKIYDAAGRLVKQFNNLTIQPFNQVVWDGHDNLGRAVSAGVYFVQFTAGDSKQIEKTILLK